MGLMVIDPGFWTTVQDKGRVGYREWGVPVGGAFDKRSADLANALVGNGPESAVLELTMRGGVYEAQVSLGLGLAGAPMEATLVSLDAHPRPLRVPSSCSLRVGDRLVLGHSREGARCYLAIKEGILTVPRMGSRSSERPIRPGDLLPTRESSIANRHIAEPDWTRPESTPIRVIAGPDATYLTAPESWSNDYFRVSSRSNRTGLRLEGPPQNVAQLTDRLSAPVCPGAIQVAGGQLIILGVAGGTMGGYPHVAHVISADLDRLGQLLPGDRIALRSVSLDQARDLDRAARRAMRAMLIRIASLARDL
jgi:biotin-dependent carboxylase-like uncharacterized protein